MLYYCRARRGQHEGGAMFILDGLILVKFSQFIGFYCI